MKKVYIAHPITNGNLNLPSVDILIQWLSKNGYKITRPNYGLFPDILAERALENIKNSTLIIADISDYSHGVGFELGYAHAHGKRIIVIAKDVVKQNISKFILGMFPDTIFYRNTEDLLASLSIRVSNTSSIK
ncbi:MAG: hypothetical protein GY855_03145 [candidate division Zixibacteria bacterium]|nr:hypothetical protein [candidate division Zixibacteria bacterium]